MDTRITWPREALTRGAFLGLVPAGLADRMGTASTVGRVTGLEPGPEQGVHSALERLLKGIEV
jgi:hypothetical protein